uniref:histidinol-phosphate transaminase n=1 Tax=Candidatus Kentrum sp. LPFa TaxID=2126335 RepID=A0A450XY20_9GAMM|nr:MAG: histidinol-phosphate aminotransferase [Candidatus Kentron sp. LPFa]VFK34214.1 MAG: histidinol-phosphate aminotransferase [Candidatus Kentron sp. LPFa]
MITLGNGANEILELAARVFASRKHEIIFSEHAFLVYSLVTQAIGARGIETPSTDFGHDLSAMLEAITPRVRVIFIANPNNPTGTWVNAAALDAFLQAVPDTVLVVVDEAYREYMDYPDYPDCVARLSRYPNLIVTRTFSKAYGLAGLRIGYAVSHPDIAALLNRVRQPFHINSMALAVATVTLDDAEHLRRTKRVNDVGYKQLTIALDELGLRYIPSVGNFVTIDVNRSGEEICARLLKKGVIVRPMARHGLPNHLRVTIGLEEENEKFIRALGDSLT